jgi:hypothetical protein
VERNNKTKHLEKYRKKKKIRAKRLKKEKRKE